MTQTLEHKISDIRSAANSHRKNSFLLQDGHLILLSHLERALEIIDELQQKNDLLQLDFNAAQEIMGGMNKEIEELKKQNKSWQEMVDSTNQTNQALCKRLK